MLQSYQNLTQRMIAGILLVSHTIMSCHNPAINPLGAAEAPGISIDQVHEQSQAKGLEISETPPAAVIRGEGATEPTQVVRLVSSGCDIATNKPEETLARQEGPLQLIGEAGQRGMKQIQQSVPIRLPSSTPTITYSSDPLSAVTKDRDRIQEREASQRTKRLKSARSGMDPVQCGLHVSILQTLQHPIWKQHFLGEQHAGTIAQLLPTSTLQRAPIRGHYQLARVQASFQPLIPIGSLATREGHRISFVQDMGCWWSMVQENCPTGFSRSVTLPVLYPPHTQHTVEVLLHAPHELQRQLVHIFSSSKTLKNAFVYIGRKMGLVGGGFWSFVGSCVASIVSSVAVGFCSGFVSGGLVGGIWGAIAGCVMGVTACVKQYTAREKTRNELESIDRRAQKACEQAIQDAKDEVRPISQEPKAYKQKRRHVLEQLNSYKKTIESEISKLEDWGKRVKEENWFLSAYWPSDKPIQETKIMWDEDFEFFKECLRNKKGDVEKINSYIQEAKDTFRKQAWADVQADKKLAEEELNEHKENFTTGMKKIVSPTELKDLKNVLAAIHRHIHSTIHNDEQWKAMYENWQKEEQRSAYAEDIAQIDRYIQSERNKLAELQIEERFIKYMERDDNMLNIQQANDPALSDEDWQNILSNAIDQGDYYLVYYIFHYRGKSPNKPIDKKQNTVLHLAISTNQMNIIQLCLQHGADKLIKNRNGKTPVDLAAPNPAIKQLLETSN